MTINDLNWEIHSMKEDVQIMKREKEIAKENLSANQMHCERLK